MWTNWSGGQQCRPSATVRPLDEQGYGRLCSVPRDAGCGVRPVARAPFSPARGHRRHPARPVRADRLVRSPKGRKHGCGSAPPAPTLAGLNVAPRPSAGLALATPRRRRHPPWPVRSPRHPRQHQPLRLAVRPGHRHADGARVGRGGRGHRRRPGRREIGLGALGVVTEVELAVRPELVLRASQPGCRSTTCSGPDYLDAHRWRSSPCSRTPRTPWLGGRTRSPTSPTRRPPGEHRADVRWSGGWSGRPRWAAGWPWAHGAPARADHQPGGHSCQPAPAR